MACDSSLLPSVFISFYCGLLIFISYGYFVFTLFACIFYTDVEVNPGPRVVAPRCGTVMFSNINGLHGNLRELAVAASRFDIVACAETKLHLPGFSAPILLFRGSRPDGLGLALYIRTGLNWLSRDSPGIMVAKVAGSRMNFYFFIVYRSPATNDRVFDCIIGTMGCIQSEDPKSACCFVGDFNCHKSDWLGSNTTDSHDIAALDFATLTDLILTNVPEFCRVAVCGAVELLVVLIIPTFGCCSTLRSAFLVLMFLRSFL